MTTTKIAIPSTKGNLAAVVHHPQTKTKKLAILFPGYLDSKDHPHLTTLAEELAERGYTAVRFDPTGTWESEGAISDYSVTQYLADVKNVFEHMLREGHYTHILLGGHSIGGLVAITYAARDPRISVVLAIMSPYSPAKQSKKEMVDRWEKENQRISLRSLPGTTEKKEYRVPFSFAKDSFRYNALDEVGALQASLILVVGTLDEVILPEDIELLFGVAHEPKKLIVAEGVGHDYRHNNDEVKMVNKLILEQMNK